MEFTIKQIANLLKAEFEGDGNVKINMLASLQNAQSGQISFLSNSKYESYLYQTNASAVIVGNQFVPKKKVKAILLRVDNPYFSFSELLEEYHERVKFSKLGVEQPSYIGDNSIVGSDVYRGAFSYIGNDVKIGNNVKIYPHVYIGDQVEIGDNCILFANVKLYSHVKLGYNCVLHSGVVIGSDGFGFAPQTNGEYKPIPQMGNVVIGNHVDIGANTVVDCATLQGDSTLIADGVKLDNMVQIGHNVKIGKHTVIAAQAGISGSTQIGEYCVIGGQVGITGHIKIADKVSIGAQSGVTKANKSGEKLWGTPAIDIMKYQKSYAYFKNLPNMNDRIKQLEEKLINLN